MKNKCRERRLAKMAAELRAAGWTVSKPPFIGSAKKAARQNQLVDNAGYERAPGIDPKTGEYSTAQMLYDEIYGGDPCRPLFD